MAKVKYRPTETSPWQDMVMTVQPVKEEIFIAHYIWDVPSLSTPYADVLAAYNAGQTIRVIEEPSGQVPVINPTYEEYRLLACYFDNGDAFVFEYLDVFPETGIKSHLLTLTQSSGWTAMSSDKYYFKPTDGIPSTDMTTAVQTSLSKADTALQSAPVTSVAGRTGAITLSKSDVGLGSVDNTADANKSVNYANSAGYAAYASSSSNYGMVLRNQGLVSSDTTPSNNGEVNWTYQ